MRVTDEQLANWTRRAFLNEEELADSTEAAIRRAIDNHPILSTMQIRILPKGSIKNNTNVRKDSDIDIAVINQNHISLEYTGGAVMAHAGLVPYTGISAAEYKMHVGDALRKEFGSNAVDGSGNRVFRIRGSNKVMNADVIPATRYMYVAPSWYREGIALILSRPDGKIHYNYPDHHHQNGVVKNNSTGRRYKRAVRILKNIENKLVAEQLIAPVPSFLIECLAYNVPDNIYNQATTWRSMVINLCVYIWQYVQTEQEPEEGLRWREVNGYKYLFGPHQRWNKQQARDLMIHVYRMVTE